MVIATSAETAVQDVCAHESVTVLGSGGGVTYTLCDDCGRVLISAGSQIWSLTPSP